MTSHQSPPGALKIGNVIMSAMLRLGISAGGNSLLTVNDRKSGMPRTTPVQVIEDQGERWIQSPFGHVNWVRNLRAAGAGTLRNGRKRESFSAIQASPTEAAPILRRIVPTFPRMIRKYYAIDDDAPLEAWECLATHHPVFRIVSAAG